MARASFKLNKILNNLHKQGLLDREMLHLTANESTMSQIALNLQASVLCERYILGDLKERRRREIYFFKKNFAINNIPAFDELEHEAREMCKKMFFCKEIDFSPLSGLHAMTALIGILTKPNDVVATLPSTCVGHYATAPLLKALGRKHVFLPYDVQKLEVDIEGLKKIAGNDIKMIYLDTMHYFNSYPLEKIKEIFPNTILVYDASHVLGLIAGGQFQSPLKEGADILSGNTHKTFPGPQKAAIFFKDKELYKKSRDIADVFTSSRHTGPSIALFVTIFEMMAFGREYARQTIKNTQTLAEGLNKKGVKVFAYPKIKPQTHQLLIKIDDLNDVLKLFKANISVNTVSLFGQNFIRLGTQQITRLGMKKVGMEHLAKIITNILKENKTNWAQKEIKHLTKKFSKVCYTFD